MRPQALSGLPSQTKSWAKILGGMHRGSGLNKFTHNTIGRAGADKLRFGMRILSESVAGFIEWASVEF